MESVSLTPLYKTRTARLRIWRRAVWVFELVGFGGSAMLPSPSSVWPAAVTDEGEAKVLLHLTKTLPEQAHTRSGSSLFQSYRPKYRFAL